MSETSFDPSRFEELYEKRERLQSLWSGYGEIARYELKTDAHGVPRTVIVKRIQPPSAADHPRGWNSDRSHQRKLRSYETEQRWYRDYACNAPPGCRLPRCYGSLESPHGKLIFLEDLDAAGFAARRSEASLSDMKNCLSWLAHFHAAFMDSPADGLWENGSYWHLETRPDELAALEDTALREAAPQLDRILREAPFATLVHGDAKLANFCFAESNATSPPVAAVDFQYVGRGCGMKDVAYFVGSCLADTECERFETALLDSYFASLAQALPEKAMQIEAAWRPLYPVAWTDFHRFLKGWSPTHWKLHSYSERIARQTLAKLERGEIR